VAIRQATREEIDMALRRRGRRRIYEASPGTVPRGRNSCSEMVRCALACALDARNQIWMANKVIELAVYFARSESVRP
jgi:hypothetical protein